MPGQIFTCTHRVSYNECTMGNHVYHSRFLDILERARGEFFRSLGCPFLQLQNEDAIFPVVHCELNFQAMARYDDLLHIELWLTELGRVRFICAGRIKNTEGALLLDSSIEMGCTTVDGKIRKLPPALREGLQAYLISSDTPE